YPDGSKEVTLQHKLSGRLTITGKNSRSVPATFYMAETGDTTGDENTGSDPARVVGYLLLHVDDAVLTLATKLTRDNSKGKSKEAEYVLSATQRQGWMPATTSAAHLSGNCKRDAIV